MCAAPSGCISVVGYLDDYKQSSQVGKEQAPDFAKLVLYSQAIVRGVSTRCGSVDQEFTFSYVYLAPTQVMVGSRTHFEEYLRLHSNDAWLATKGRPFKPDGKSVLTPVVDKIFPIVQAKRAFQLVSSGQFFGKILVDISGEMSGKQ